MAEWPAVWNATWIWSDRPPVRGTALQADLMPPRETWNRLCFLRRAFDLADLPDSVPARVTADSRFVLFVNGREAARGPARSIPERLAYVEVDLAPSLRAGRNAVAALVRFYGRPVAWWRPAPPNGQLGYGSFAIEAPAIDLRSDDTWRALAAPYEPDRGGDPFYPTTEAVDGAGVPDGWTNWDFDDAAWDAAVMLRAGAATPDRFRIPAAPYTLPEPEAIAPRTVTPVSLRPLPPAQTAAAALDGPLAAYAAGDGGAVAALVYDAGGITLATPWVAVAGEAGAIVDLYAGEDLRAGGMVEINPRRWALRYRLRGSNDAAPERIEAFDAVGFRYLAVVARGNARVVAAGATERVYPRQGEARFVCDDERLNGIWRAGLRTLDVCTSDAFMDCPGREQRAWLGDAYVETLVGLATNADTRLIRRNLRISAHSQRGDGLLAMAAAGDLSLGATTIPDYSLHWLRALARYVEWTGDDATARELLPVALDIVAFFEHYRGAGDLLRHVPGWVFIDWAMDARGEVTAALDALYAAALYDLAALLGGAGAAAEQVNGFRTLAERSCRALQTLWDDERGVYLDAMNGDQRLRRVSQQTNAAVIVAGGATPDQRRRALDYILDERRIVTTPTYGDRPDRSPFEMQQDDPVRYLPFDDERNVVAAQPFFAHFLHQAVAPERLPDLCIKWWPLLQDGADVLGEFWSALPGAASRAHAWSATPTYDLIRHVLGVSVDLGRGRARIAPTFGRLQRLEGMVPTPAGPLTLDLTRERGIISVPPGLTADVVAPGSSGAGRDLQAGTHRAWG